MAGLCLACPAVVAEAVAPDISALSPGDQVRVLAPAVLGPKRVQASVVTADPTALRVKVKDRLDPVAIRPADLVRLELGRVVGNRRSRGALLGALPWAALVGLVVASGGVDESGIVSVPSAVVLTGGVLLGGRIGARMERVEWFALSLRESEATVEISPETLRSVREEFASRIAREAHGLDTHRSGADFRDYSTTRENGSENVGRVIGEAWTNVAWPAPSPRHVPSSLCFD